MQIVFEDEFLLYQGKQCRGSGHDVDFEGTAQECADECASRDDCTGFVRINSGSIFSGTCYLKSGVLSDPVEFTEDNVDCYQRLFYENYKIYPGYDCTGSETEIFIKDKDTAQDCADECSRRSYCVGFTYINSESDSLNGECTLHAGELNDPFVFTEDDRDCYERIL